MTKKTGKHRPRVAASNSFTPGELKLLLHIIRKLPLLREFWEVVRNPHYGSLTRKILKMVGTVKRAQRERQVEDRLAEERDKP